MGILSRLVKYGGFFIREDDCSYVWNIDVDKRCEWVKNQPNCQTDSIVQYTHILFCSFAGESSFALGLFLLVLWLLYLFLILGTTADNFFCPSLSVIAGVLHLSENIAGVTILAFGNGAPDIFTSLVADEGEMVIMFTELIGAGIFVTAIIAGAVAIASPCRIPFKSVTRDCWFYIISVCWICYTSYDKIIHLWEALSLIFIYMMFIFVVVTMQCYENKEQKLKGRIPRFQDPELLRTYVAYRTGADDSAIRPSTKVGLRSRAYSLHAKLDVAIATELATRRRMGGAAAEDTTADDATTDASLSSHRPTGLFREFLYDINPINADDWTNGNCIVKTILVLQAPVTLLLQCLIPVVNETVEKRGWSKLLNSLQLVITPTLALFKLEVWHKSIGPVPIVMIVFIIGLMAAVFVFLTTDISRCPKYHDDVKSKTCLGYGDFGKNTVMRYTTIVANKGFAFLGFVSAMLVVYIIANEVMAVLECIGYASKITDAMLGITLLAWGNSVGDLISNIAVARQGFPRMGYSACFGGPLFNTLLGLGFSWAIAAVRHDDYRVKIRLSDMMPGCLVFLLASLVASLVYLNIVGFVVRRSYGYLLCSLYFVFLLINVLSEVHVIHPLGTDHRPDI